MPGNVSLTEKEKLVLPPTTSLTHLIAISYELSKTTHLGETPQTMADSSVLTLHGHSEK